ncbi:hypothetical protein ARMSODRAFT_960320 [Armillaria solidipes]|uniref:Uncharacterized protein n=1 Tax=Armillaria solidipes TaxID=1076256 RepID=A0A2H3B9H3_9AGAR|nr:hypothetical protein ARMSODRAFT_960320 [Armillaria solidipes]
MRQLDLSLSLRSDARGATILALPGQLDTDVLPWDAVDAIALCGGTPSRRLSLDHMTSLGDTPTIQGILRS